MKGLLISEPWIGRILAGRKTWEMRKRACHETGTVALIRSGSGLVVAVADMAGSLPPLETREAYAAAEARHAIRPEEQEVAFARGWRTPWVLENVCQLPRPIPYAHPSGAVIWVRLDEDVVTAVRAQLDELSPAHKGPVTAPPSPDARQVPQQQESTLATLEVPSSFPCRFVRLTGGNIRNNHIYLPLDFFPADAIGGRNRDDAARRPITVTFDPGTTIRTDIDRTKRILRARAPVGDFLARAGLQEGDSVRIECTAPHSYVFSKA